MRQKPSSPGNRRPDTDNSDKDRKQFGGGRANNKPGRFKGNEEGGYKPKRQGNDGEKNRTFDSRDQRDKPYKKRFDREEGSSEKSFEEPKAKRVFRNPNDKINNKFSRFEDKGKPKYGKSSGDRKTNGGFRKSDDRSHSGSNRFDDKDRPKFDKPYGDRKPGKDFRKSEDKPYSRPNRFEDKDKPKFNRSSEDDRSGKEFRKSEDRPYKRPNRFEDKNKPKFDRPFGDRKPGRDFNKSEDRPHDRPNRFDADEKRPDRFQKRYDSDKPKRTFDKKRPNKKREHIEEPDVDMQMTLNKYIAHSGECSRRDAAELVKQGKVKVNGELITDPGYRVKQSDRVTLVGKKLTPHKQYVYMLLNKPKGFITTTEDPEGRKTVMELVANSGVDRLFPVGRLDRNTTGLLLLTNDGDLAQRLSHPSYQIKKIYQVTLNKPLTKADFEKVLEGVSLEDGVANVDALSYLEEKNELGLEIHSGRNRIVRRIFEALGYEVDKLDRVMYAGLTKKNLPRSKWRFLEEREIILLKHFKS
ncbi:MAG TPA: pseudouridine synthase [Flavipsychrobacter sp.]|nr:pseudouridine synthase [Flavipsychrobacter sp.]